MRRRRKSVWIDMTPLVDVAFLLLTFFMLTATFRITEGVSVDLPVAHARQKIDRDKLVLITLDHAGTVFLRSFLDDKSSAYDTYQAVSLTSLKEYLNSRTDKSGIQAVIQADRGLRYERIEPILQVVREAGLRSVRLAAQSHE